MKYFPPVLEFLTDLDRSEKKTLVGPSGLGYKELTLRPDEDMSDELTFLDKYGKIKLPADDEPDVGDWRTITLYKGDNPDDNILNIAASKEQQVAVVANSAKAEDVKWTEAMIDSLFAIFGIDLKSLKWLVRYQIIKPPHEIRVGGTGPILDTPEAIDYVFKRKNADPTQELTIDATSSDNTEKELFNYLAAQTHVGRVLQLLKDYREDFGGTKKILKLHLYGPESDESRESHTIVIELSD